MQIGMWLSFVIDTISLSFTIPEEVSKLKGLLDSAFQVEYSSFCELLRITGANHFNCFECLPNFLSFDQADVFCH